MVRANYTEKPATCHLPVQPLIAKRCNYASLMKSTALAVNILEAFHWTILMAVAVESSEIRCEQRTERSHWKAVAPAAAVIMFINSALILWFVLDHTLPFWDTAAHAWNVLTCARLLSNPALLSYQWWHDIMNLSAYYPPVYYLSAATVKLCVPKLELALEITHIAFLTIFCASIYSLTWLYTHNRVASVVATILPVFVYPVTFYVAHFLNNDLPALSLTAFSYLLFERCRRSHAWTGWSLAGVMFALTVLTKQYCALFLAPLVMIWLIGDRQVSMGTKLSKLGIFVAAALVIMTPWMVLALPDYVQTFVRVNNEFSHPPSFWQNFSGNFVEYWRQIAVEILSPFGALLGGAAIALARKETHRKLAIFVVPSIVCVVVISTFQWHPYCRYVSPIMIPVAIYSGLLISNLISASGSRKAIAAIVLALSVFQFVIVNFVPGLFPDNDTLRTAREVMGVTNETSWEQWGRGFPIAPNPKENFHQLDILRRVNDSATTTQTIGILSDNARFNYNTFEYLRQRYDLKHIAYLPFRENSAAGDRCVFADNRASACNWFIANPGAGNVQLAGPADVLEIRKWTSFVRRSGKFKLELDYKLPDGSRVELWQRL